MCKCRLKSEASGNCYNFWIYFILFILFFSNPHTCWASLLYDMFKRNGHYLVAPISSPIIYLVIRVSYLIGPLCGISKSNGYYLVAPISSPVNYMIITVSSLIDPPCGISKSNGYYLVAPISSPVNYIVIRVSCWIGPLCGISKSITWWHPSPLPWLCHWVSHFLVSLRAINLLNIMIF